VCKRQKEMGRSLRTTGENKRVKEEEKCVRTIFFCCLHHYGIFSFSSREAVKFHIVFNENRSHASYSWLCLLNRNHAHRNLGYPTTTFLTTSQLNGNFNGLYLRHETWCRQSIGLSALATRRGLLRRLRTM